LEFEISVIVICLIFVIWNFNNSMNCQQSKSPLGITKAWSYGPGYLLLDDRAGREVAARLNIFTTGLIGLLLVAKEKGFVERVGAHIKELRNNGYWLSDDIMKTAIKLAGE